MTTDAPFAATEQAREFGDRVSETGRLFGRQTIDAYERAINNAVEFERAAAAVAPAEWLRTALGAHATFVADVNAAYVGALRSVID